MGAKKRSRKKRGKAEMEVMDPILEEIGMQALHLPAASRRYRSSRDTERLDEKAAKEVLACSPKPPERVLAIHQRSKSFSKDPGTTLLTVHLPMEEQLLCFPCHCEGCGGAKWLPLWLSSPPKWPPVVR